MPDIATIGAALTSLKTATEIVKALRDVDVSLEKAEIKLKVIDLANALVEARTKVVEIQEVIQEKDKRIAELGRALEFKSKLIRHADAYYETDGTNPIGAPYCTHCWEVNHKAVHIQMFNSIASKCPACANLYQRNRVPFYE